jgi:predicted amidohydrolase
MNAAVGQFAVTPAWRKNLAACQAMMRSARRPRADLLVLPQAVLARSDNDPDLSVISAQPLDGVCVQGLLTASCGYSLTTALTIHVPTSPGGAANTLLALRAGTLRKTPSL